MLLLEAVLDGGEGNRDGVLPIIAISFCSTSRNRIAIISSTITNNITICSA